MVSYIVWMTSVQFKSIIFVHYEALKYCININIEVSCCSYKNGIVTLVLSI